MKKKNNDKYVEELYQDFIHTYSYISVERDVVRAFVDAWGMMSDRERELDLLRDYILAGDYAEDVME